MARRAVQPGRLRRRLTIAFVLVAGVSAAALALTSYLLVSRARLADSLQQGKADARQQLFLAHDQLQGKQLGDDESASLLNSFENTERPVVLVRGEQIQWSDARLRPAVDPPTRAMAEQGQLAYQRSTDDTGRHLLIVGGPIPGSTGQLYVVRVEDRVYQDLDQMRTALLAGWALVVILAAGVGHILARRTLEPVGRASAAARAVAEGLLSTRLPEEGHDEFGAWAASFNRMAEALEAKIVALSEAHARERRFTADVAHELRTPVTALVAEASLLRDHLDQLPAGARRPAQLLVADMVRLRHLVEELMELSRLDAGQEDVSVRPVDVTAMLRAIVDTGGWRDRVQLAGEAVTIATDPRRLERILANIVANAVQHGGGDVRVVVSADAAVVRVRVSDNGPGIPAEQLPRLFDRFYKADPARSGAGSGLGLAIAWEHTRLLGADLQVSSVVGVGTEFCVSVPVTRQLPSGEATVEQDADGEAHRSLEGGPP